MSTMNDSERITRVPVAVQVAAIVALGAGLVVVGILRAAHDVPMAIAMVTMGLAILPEAVLCVRRSRRGRRDAAAVPTLDELSRRRTEPAGTVAEDLVAA